MRRLGLVATTVAASLICANAPAVPARSPEGAAEQRALAGPQAKVYGYLTPTVMFRMGDSLVFTNLDIDRHNVVHDTETDGFGGPHDVPWCKPEKARGKKKKGGHAHQHGSLCPVFYSELVGLGTSAHVAGLENLEPGKTYTFFCTLHHGMKGQLVVSG